MNEQDRKEEYKKSLDDFYRQLGWTEELTLQFDNETEPTTKENSDDIQLY